MHDLKKIKIKKKLPSPHKPWEETYIYFLWGIISNERFTSLYYVYDKMSQYFVEKDKVHKLINEIQ